MRLVVGWEFWPLPQIYIVSKKWSLKRHLFVIDQKREKLNDFGPPTKKFAHSRLGLKIGLVFVIYLILFKLSMSSFVKIGFISGDKFLLCFLTSQVMLYDVTTVLLYLGYAINYLWMFGHQEMLCLD